MCEILDYYEKSVIHIQFILYSENDCLRSHPFNEQFFLNQIIIKLNYKIRYMQKTKIKCDILSRALFFNLVAILSKFKQIPMIIVRLHRHDHFCFIQRNAPSIQHHRQFKERGKNTKINKYTIS